MLRIPHKLAENLELLERIGRGGMGEVYRARMTGPGGFSKVVAVKAMLSTLSDEKELLDSFLVEANALSKLSHPNIVQIFQAGHTADGIPYLVLEWINGASLKEILESSQASGGSIPPHMVCEILRQTFMGLAEAHGFTDPDSNEKLKIIHRDLSPHNVMIDQHGVVKLLDFGLAKILHAAQVNTQTSFLKGKFNYLSPEAASGKPLDERSDLFSVGCLAFELLTGVKPFDGISDFDILEHIKKGEYATSALSNSTLSKSLVTFVEKLLQSDPTKRFSSAREALGDLTNPNLYEECQSGELASLIPKKTRSISIDRTVIESPPRIAKKSIPLRSIASATVLVVLIGLGTWFYTAQYFHAGRQGTRNPNSALSKPPIPAESEPDGEPAVKRSSTGICHARGSLYFPKIKHFTSHNSIEECLKVPGSRLPMK